MRFVWSFVIAGVIVNCDCEDRSNTVQEGIRTGGLPVNSIFPTPTNLPQASYFGTWGDECQYLDGDMGVKPIFDLKPDGTFTNSTKVYKLENHKLCGRYLFDAIRMTGTIANIDYFAEDKRFIIAKQHYLTWTMQCRDVPNDQAFNCEALRAMCTDCGFVAGEDISVLGKSLDGLKMGEGSPTLYLELDAGLDNDYYLSAYGLGFPSEIPGFTPQDFWEATFEVEP